MLGDGAGGGGGGGGASVGVDSSSSRDGAGEATAADGGREGAAEQDWGQESRDADEAAAEEEELEGRGAPAAAAVAVTADPASGVSSSGVAGATSPVLAVTDAPAPVTPAGSFVVAKPSVLPSLPVTVGDSRSGSGGGGGGEGRAGAPVLAVTPASTMPAAAPEERAAPAELGRFLTPRDVEGSGADVSASLPSMPSFPLSGAGEASGASAAAAAEQEEEEEEKGGEGSSEEDDGISSEDGEQR